MALRLRRGTNAERQLITPKAGELIYTTDTKALYIGDGTTAGGNIVQGGGGGGNLNSLSDVTVGTVSNGQVLAYNGGTADWRPTNLESVSFGNANQHTDILYPDGQPNNGDILLHDGTNFVASALVDSQMRLSIVGSDSSLLVDHITSSIVGDVVGGDLKVNSITTLIDTSEKTANGLKLKHDNGTVAYDPNLARFNGDFIGNFQGDIYTSVAAGTVKIFEADTGQFFGDVQGDIFATDSTRIVDSKTATFNGTFNGTSNGDHNGTFKGSVFADDSSTMIDGISGYVTGPVKSESVQGRNVHLGTLTDPNTMYLVTNSTGTNFIISTEAANGTIQFPRNTLIGSSQASVGSKTLRIYNDTATEGTIPVSILHANDSSFGSNMGVLRARGTKSAPTAVQIGDVLGGYGMAGYNGSAYKGASGIRSVVDAAPQSTHIPASIQMYNTKADGTQQVVLSIGTIDSTAAFTGPVKVPNFADDAARNSAVTNPQAGMIIFHVGTAKFQGYDGTAWVALH